MGGVTRREIDELTERARRFGAKGLVYLALEPGGEVKGPIAKFLSDDTQRAIIERAGAADGDLVLIVADPRDTTADVLGRLRVELGDRLGLADPNVLSYVWVHRFPMYQWDAEIGRWDATHNPFSGVMPEDEPLLVTAPATRHDRRPRTRPAGPGRSSTTLPSTAGSWAAVRSGSIAASCSSAASRSRAIRSRAMREKFGAVLDAFEYGAPPHGGIAIGIDRWAALLAHQTNIREVMAFPKTQSGTDLMLEAPSIPARPIRGARSALRGTAGAGDREGHSMERPAPSASSAARPVVRLASVVEPGMAEIWVKLEGANPTGSYKDRMALAMIEGAERSGRLQPGQRVIEYSGGSTGSSLAFVCAIKGYPLTVVSSDAFAVEKLKTMRAFGADVVIIPSPEGITPTLIPRMQARAAEIAAETGAYRTDQFHNTDMIDGYRAMGTELLEQLDGRIDAICLYVGTAGCYLGVTRAVRERLPDVRAGRR